MKIVLLSLSIALIGYFALQTLTDGHEARRLAANSPDVSAETTTESRGAARVHGHR